MAPPILTWNQSSKEAVSTTAALHLTGIKNLLDASTNWQTSASELVTPPLFVEAAPVSVDPDVADLRILFTAGSTPHANALALGASGNTTHVFAGIAPNAGTTGPDTAYTGASPYSSRFLGLAPICPHTSSPVTEYYLVESEEILALIGRTATATNSHWFFGGAAMVAPNDNAGEADGRIWSQFAAPGGNAFTIANPWSAGYYTPGYISAGGGSGAGWAFKPSSPTTPVLLMSLCVLGYNLTTTLQQTLNVNNDVIGLHHYLIDNTSAEKKVLGRYRQMYPWGNGVSYSIVQDASLVDQLFLYGQTEAAANGCFAFANF